jgi:pimeloyl-ACP methyl ester carboxylesterase
MPTLDETIDIPVDDLTLDGTLVRPGATVPGVLFVHGWGGSQQHYLGRAREIAALGCMCLTFDLRGHAQTRARFDTVTREDNLQDVVAAYDRLAAEPGVDRGAMAVVGSSYGGYLAAILTSVRPVRWLALRAPALYKDEDWDLPKGVLNKRQNLVEYRLGPVRAEQSIALRACAAFRGDALLVESEHDRIIPHQVVLNYRDALACTHSLTYRVISGADHGLGDARWQQAYTSLLTGWMGEMLGGARGHWEAEHVAEPARTASARAARKPTVEPQEDEREPEPAPQPEPDDAPQPGDVAAAEVLHARAAD